MNILPKKKWHVRTKENMARVRRDEAAAAAAEESRLERVKLAEQERRVELLKAKQDQFKSVKSEGATEYSEGLSSTFSDRAALKGEATASTSRLTSSSASGQDGLASSSNIGQGQASKHLNFFEELEQQERSNMASVNKEYQAEKKAEQHAWESKMGIMKKFAEDTNEITGTKHWWESIERIKPEEEQPKKKTKEHKVEKKEKKKKKKRKRRYSSSSDEDSAEAKKKRLQAMREERIRREEAEKQREAKFVKR
ncbi:unnamed protein product [Bursaphelenchus okinawaensis]|uniref:CBF1-interacting co-repressor CIR N-terminal domain-containing protein n=1 Tax=Bursaphelenchus okinawaensis TaxID=465554 RepID=A0A811JUI1_9BILA|nr:unnamed protein product [Bursaphelenchus okinawaensis]CAG9083686.1 unnamed protein product [Bursaphelenchus okinawaensis]